MEAEVSLELKESLDKVLKNVGLSWSPQIKALPKKN